MYVTRMARKRSRARGQAARSEEEPSSQHARSQWQTSSQVAALRKQQKAGKEESNWQPVLATKQPARKRGKQQEFTTHRIEYMCQYRQQNATRLKKFAADRCIRSAEYRSLDAAYRALLRHHGTFADVGLIPEEAKYSPCAQVNTIERLHERLHDYTTTRTTTRICQGVISGYDVSCVQPSWRTGWHHICPRRSRSARRESAICFGSMSTSKFSPQLTHIVSTP